MTAPTIIREQLVEGVTLWPGDCRAVLPTLAPNSFDSCVTDPPYHLTSIVKRFGGDNAAPAQFGKDGAFSRASKGFMGRQWDGGDIAFDPETWRQVYRALKPGGYCVAFSSSRTYHRMACAIEDAGFITHPLIAWITGQGFPKAHSVSKHIDRMAGAERKVVGEGPFASRRPRADHSCQGLTFADDNYVRPAGHAITAPATDAAREWDGWYYGTQSLKPAIEPIFVGQKPFERGLNGTQNILKWGTGALNIGACRVATDIPRPDRVKIGGNSNGIYGDGLNNSRAVDDTLRGRWPANLIHDGSDEVMAAFPETGASPKTYVRGANGFNANVYGSGMGEVSGKESLNFGDSGSAARFFYTAKADQDDRLGSKHPTIKPVSLIRYLARLVTPPGGLVLDPFAGTGTLGEAAFHEGMKAVLIEREEEYCADIRRRMALVMSGSGERKREGIKARHAEKPADHGPLFGAPG